MFIQLIFRHMAQSYTTNYFQTYLYYIDTKNLWQLPVLDKVNMDAKNH